MSDKKWSKPCPYTELGAHNFELLPRADEVGYIDPAGDVVIAICRQCGEAR